MNYEEALNWIMSYWEPGGSKAHEKALRALKVPRMRALLERIGSPHLKYPSILVAGTKGKGSTAAFIAEGLRAAGYRVGRYTQPHLIDWCERTWVDGKSIEPRDVACLVERVKPPVEEIHRGMGELGGLTTYEIGTAITLSHFADRQVEIAVLEIGIGGRLDALNAVDPVLSVVTSISLDHTDVLGDSLAEIAKEKAGIFRQGRAAVSAPQSQEAEAALRQAAMETGAHLYLVGRDWRWRESAESGMHLLYQGGRENRSSAERQTVMLSGERSISSWVGRACGDPFARLRAGSSLDAQDDGVGAQDDTMGDQDDRVGARDDNLGARDDRHRDLRERTIDIVGSEGVIEGVKIPLLGDHQRDNATSAAAALQLLRRGGFRRIDGEAIRRGLESVEWPGRIQLLRRDPLVVVDAAHNEDSVCRLLDTIEKQFHYEQLVLVFGASSDKHVEEMAQRLGPAAHLIIVTASGHRRAADAERLALEFSQYTDVFTEPDPKLAFDRALGIAGTRDLILITGSVFLAGRAVEHWGGKSSY